MENILDVILKDTFTLSQLKHRLSLLKSHLMQTIFSKSENAPLLTKSESAWLESLPSEFLKKFDQNNINEVFENLEKQVTLIKPLTLYLTFEPDEATLSQIGAYTRKTFGRPILLDIKYDPKLIAGTSIVWNGLLRDYSLRARLEERKMLILESFKKILR